MGGGGGGVQGFSLKGGEKKGTAKKLEIDPMSHGNRLRVQERAGGDRATQEAPQARSGSGDRSQTKWKDGFPGRHAGKLRKSPAAEAWEGLHVRGSEREPSTERSPPPLLTRRRPSREWPLVAQSPGEKMCPFEAITGSSAKQEVRPDEA